MLFWLSFLEAAALPGLEAAVLFLHLKSILNETALYSDAAGPHFDPRIQGHFAIVMVFSS